MATVAELQAQLEATRSALAAMEARASADSAASGSGSAAHGVGAPWYWDTDPLTPFPAAGCRKVELTSPSLRAHFQALLEDTARRGHQRQHGGRMVLKRVFRVQNDKLFVAYATHRDLLEPAAGAVVPRTHVPASGAWLARALGVQPAANEVLLFHGTTHAVADRVCADGFDERYCAAETADEYGPGWTVEVSAAAEAARAAALAERRPFFGAGIYFQEHSTKADVEARRAGGAGRYAFVARFALGRCFETNAARRDERRPPGGHDSLAGVVPSGCGGDGERQFVVYDGWQAYPEFLLEYDRE